MPQANHQGQDEKSKASSRMIDVLTEMFFYHGATRIFKKSSIHEKERGWTWNPAGPREENRVRQAQRIEGNQVSAKDRLGRSLVRPIQPVVGTQYRTDVEQANLQEHLKGDWASPGKLVEHAFLPAWVPPTANYRPGRIQLFDLTIEQVHDK